MTAAAFSLKSLQSNLNPVQVKVDLGVPNSTRTSILGKEPFQSLAKKKSSSSMEEFIAERMERTIIPL